MEPFFSDAIEKSTQDALQEAFGQDGYIVRHSPFICDYHKCTDGNRVLCKDGVIRGFRRYIDVSKKRVYWAFANDNGRLVTYKY